MAGLTFSFTAFKSSASSCLSLGEWLTCWPTIKRESVSTPVWALSHCWRILRTVGAPLIDLSHGCIHRLDSIDHEMNEMVAWDPVSHGRGKQHGGITVDDDEICHINCTAKTRPTSGIKSERLLEALIFSLTFKARFGIWAWKSLLSDSNSRPTFRRAESDCLSLSYQSVTKYVSSWLYGGAQQQSRRRRSVAVIWCQALGGIRMASPGLTGRIMPSISMVPAPSRMK